MKKQALCLSCVFTFFFSFAVYAQNQSPPDPSVVVQKLFERGVADDAEKPSVYALWVSRDFITKVRGFLGVSDDEELKKQTWFFELLENSIVLMLVFSSKDFSLTDTDFVLQTNTGLRIMPNKYFPEEMGLNAGVGGLTSDFENARALMFPVCKGAECLLSKDVKEITLHIRGKAGIEMALGWTAQQTDQSWSISPKNQNFQDWVKLKGLDKEMYQFLMTKRDDIKINEAMQSLHALRRAMEYYAADNDGVYPPLHEDCGNMTQLLGSYGSMEKILADFDGAKLEYCAVKGGKSYLLKARAKDSHKTPVKATATDESIDKDK